MSFAKNLMSEFVIEPKCFPFDIDGNPKQLENCPAHTATGYLLPCCWLDITNGNLEDELNGVRVPELHLSTGITYKEIVHSHQWKNFYIKLFTSPETAVDKCKEKCGRYK